jgi:hypothetical protein
MLKFLSGVLGIILFCSVVFSTYWLAKTISYKLFYRDMVRAEISEMINNHMITDHQIIERSK